MRIIAGKHRGRRLAPLSGPAIRPSSDRLRQSLFNILEHGKHDVQLNGARVVDVFAGTGALGLEALSRGAERAIFIENEPMALNVLRQNLALCGEDERAEIISVDATKPPPTQSACNFVFLDPPYYNGLAAPALAALAGKGWFKHRAACSVELARDEVFVPPPGFTKIGERTYGLARLIILRWQYTSETTPSNTA